MRETRSHYDEDMMSRLIGKVNEYEIIMANCTVKALINTGSMVSTLAEDLHKDIANKPELGSLEDFSIDMHLYCANGEKVPYIGYIVQTMTVDSISDKEIIASLLIVPSTEYNKKVKPIVFQFEYVI